MKLSVFVLLPVVGAAVVGKPELSISLRDGSFKGLDGLEPTVTWSHTAKSGDMDIEYGVEASATPTSDLASLPRKIWGKVSTDFSGWAVTARADVDAQDRANVDIEIDADNDKNDLSVHLVATGAGDDFSVKSVEATKGMEQKGGRLEITPRYDLENDDRDVVVSYDSGDTNVKLTASTESQEITISQQIDKDNRIAPTLTSDGDISVEWERNLGGDGSLTVVVKPNDSIDVEWNDGDWKANVNMPVDGKSIKGADVSISRDITLP